VQSARELGLPASLATDFWYAEALQSMFNAVQQHFTSGVADCQVTGPRLTSA